MNSAVEDEIISINSIYSSETLTQETTSQVLLLKLPTTNATLRLSFPQNYPDEPPEVLGSASSGSNTRKGVANEIASLARNVLSECFTPGVPCIYDLIEHVMAKTPEEVSAGEELEPQADEAELSNSPSQNHSVVHDCTPDWTVSDPIIENKSVFIARAARVESPDEARAFLAGLVATDKKVAKATHNITAWRIKGTAGAVYQDCDDDGEDAAGGRLLHLLQMVAVWNCVVVVSRWYGGIKLGPKRFSLINNAARDSLVKGGFVVKGEKVKGEK